MSKYKYYGGRYGGYLNGDYGDGWEGGYYWQPEPVRPLMPHKAETKVERIGDSEIPEILVSLEAYQDIQCIMDESGTDEIGWLGTVREVDGKYLIEKVFIFNQTVSSGSCEFDQDSISKFYMDMLKADPNNKAMLNSILFWGHVHPGGSVTPSQQDEDQMTLFTHNKYFIRGIFSRSGHCVFTFFDYVRKLKIVDCPWQIDIKSDTSRRKEIAKEIKKKVVNFIGGGKWAWPTKKGKDHEKSSLKDKDKDQTFGDS